MSVVLFVDMLGARKRWQTGGIAESKRSFNTFTKHMIAVTRQEVANEVEDGGIETDSAMLVCKTLQGALKIARRLYLNIFLTPMRSDAPRLWLRGCVVPHHDNVILRKESKINAPLEALCVYTYSPSALDAISVEKSGYRGMRLIVRKELINREVMSELRIPFDNHSMVTFTTLRYSGYPKSSTGVFSDFLWMACKDDDEWFDLNLHMTNRLRYSASDVDEAAQATATQVVYHEVGAIRQSVISRARRAAEKKLAT